MGKLNNLLQNLHRTFF